MTNKGLFVICEKKNGFKKQTISDIAKDSISEDLGGLIFDADNDGDNDIYMVSGGNEFTPTSPWLKDRLYVNNGEGKFSKSSIALPEMITSGSRVQPFDYDNDGDLDLFVGGRLVPQNYPSPADSYILENVSTKGNPKYIDVTNTIAPSLKKIGLVSDARWTDFDQDGLTDIIIVGEWMPITILRNTGGKFENITDKLGLEKSTGWWFSIEEGDFDQDGDMDFIVGNLGLNYKYKATENETFDIYFNDFDNNQKNDIVLSYYNEGEKFPLRGRECSSQQIPGIKDKFKDYKSFSNATFEDVYSKETLKESLHYQATSFESIYLENTSGSFKLHALPKLAQFSSINKILVEDFDKDNHLDLIIAGNLHSSEVETPRNDAANGLFLKGNSTGNFTPIEGYKSGFYVPGDVKDLARITIGGESYILAAKNGDYVQFVKIMSRDPIN